VEEAASRRLQEEMGFTAPLLKLFEFMYRAEVENHLIEHEYDHVFVGYHEGSVTVNKNEVSDYCYEDMDRIKWAIKEQPEKFTVWFKLAFPSIETWWQQEYEKE
jgi:isopentenyl-diphosphate delta-isomerase